MGCGDGASNVVDGLFCYGRRWCVCWVMPGCVSVVLVFAVCRWLGFCVKLSESW